VGVEVTHYFGEQRTLSASPTAAGGPGSGTETNETPARVDSSIKV
jgi:hypothetical protein